VPVLVLRIFALERTVFRHVCFFSGVSSAIALREPLEGASLFGAAEFPVVGVFGRDSPHQRVYRDPGLPARISEETFFFGTSAVINGMKPETIQQNRGIMNLVNTEKEPYGAITGQAPFFVKVFHLVPFLVFSGIFTNNMQDHLPEIIPFLADVFSSFFGWTKQLGFA